jgi:hypothetical protein
MACAPVEQKRRLAHHAQRGRPEERAFHAVSGAVAKHAPRGAAGGAARLLVIGQVVEEALDSLGSVEPPEDGPLGRRKTIGNHSESE